MDLLLEQFFDSKFVCQSEGREVSRVQKAGKVLLKFNVVTKGTVCFTFMKSVLCAFLTKWNLLINFIRNADVRILSH